MIHPFMFDDDLFRHTLSSDEASLPSSQFTAGWLMLLLLSIGLAHGYRTSLTTTSQQKIIIIFAPLAVNANVVNFLYFFCFRMLVCCCEITH